MNRKQKIKDIVELTRNLDITPRMIKNATEKYTNLGKYLDSRGFGCEIFPIGSFATGTVIRPYYNDKDQDYDLDFICLTDKHVEETTAKETKRSVYEELSKNETYNSLFNDREWEKCWTLEYAEVNGVGFSMDIVPAAHIRNENNPVVITNKNGEIYEWKESQPKALVNWFNNINEPYLQASRNEERAMLLKRYSDVYTSIEEIPETLERSSLQRVIQLLKRHRDIYFSKVGKKYSVPSIIITTLVGEIAARFNPVIDFYDLLSNVIDELADYSKYTSMSESCFLNEHTDKSLIKRVNGEWIIENPIDSYENLAESWRNDEKMVSLFFDWIEQVKKDFLDESDLSEELYLASMGNAFGYDYFNKSEVRKRYNLKRPKRIDSIRKPYGET
jgi:hypothetical protein